jgi:hypothetical protein
MKHDILGEVRRKRKSAHGIATIRYESRDIEVQIIPDDQPFETTLALAADVVGQLPKLDKAAKRAIVADLRDPYNDGWNEYDEVQADGSLKSVSQPKLSAAAFKEKFSLNAINVTGSDMVEFFYDDSGLFDGHAVIVCSLDGTDFGDAEAELAG